MFQNIVVIVTNMASTTLFCFEFSKKCSPIASEIPLSIWKIIYVRWFIYPWMHARVVIRANYAGNRSNWICQASGKWRQVRAANLCMQILCCTQYTGSSSSVNNTNWFRNISIVSIFYCQPVYVKYSLCHDYFGCIDKCFPSIFMAQNKHKETIWVCNTNPKANGLFWAVFVSV